MVRTAPGEQRRRNRRNCRDWPARWIARLHPLFLRSFWHSSRLTRHTPSTRKNERGVNGNEARERSPAVYWFWRLKNFPDNAGPISPLQLWSSRILRKLLLCLGWCPSGRRFPLYSDPGVEDQLFPFHAGLAWIFRATLSRFSAPRGFLSSKRAIAVPPLIPRFDFIENARSW